MSPLFTASDVWSGGYFELEIMLGPRSDDRLQRAMQALWNHGSLDGCYQRNDLEPAEQSRVAWAEAAASVSASEFEHPYYGVATAPNGRSIACASFAIRFESDAESDAQDLLSLGVPMGSLGEAYPVGAYPFADQVNLGWRSEVEEWLRVIAVAVFESVPFPFASIGHEVDEFAHWREIVSGGVTDERWNGYLVERDSALVWYPANQGAPITF